MEAGDTRTRWRRRWRRQRSPAERRGKAAASGQAGEGAAAFRASPPPPFPSRRGQGPPAPPRSLPTPGPRGAGGPRGLRGDGKEAGGGGCHSALALRLGRGVWGRHHYRPPPHTVMPGETEGSGCPQHPPPPPPGRVGICLGSWVQPGGGGGGGEVQCLPRPLPCPQATGGEQLGFVPQAH